MTIKKSQLRKIKQSINRVSVTEKRGYFAVIGKLTGEVLTDKSGIIYVTTFEGQNLEVLNRRVPNNRGDVVFVGTDKLSANRVEVLFTLSNAGSTSDGTSTATNIVPPHNHSWPNANTTWIYSYQIMWLLAKPIAKTLTIQIYPGASSISLPSG